MADFIRQRKVPLILAMVLVIVVAAFVLAVVSSSLSQGSYDLHRSLCLEQQTRTYNQCMVDWGHTGE